MPNRHSPPAILLRESYRDRGKVKKRTLANLSQWPPALIEGLRTLLKGGRAIAHPPDAFDIVRSHPHGHVAAVLGTLKALRLDRLIARQDCPERQRVLALIATRILAPGSKLATARGLRTATVRDSLAEALALGAVDEDDLYAAMDWLLTRQERIERTLAERRLKDGALVLYDLTSVYLEGRACPLAQRGYARDGTRGKLQIEFGLLCDSEGCPVAVEVFEGNTADPMTVGAQIDKLRTRFGLSKVALVGDRGMLTEARIREEVQAAGLDWISALRSFGHPPTGGGGHRATLTVPMSRTWWKCAALPILASASWSVAIRCWPHSGRARARTCWPPPRDCWRPLRLRRNGPNGAFGARTG